jgi:hypothetical protein
MSEYQTGKDVQELQQAVAILDERLKVLESAAREAETKRKSEL